MYSYELFKSIPTVRYAPDLIFNLENNDNTIQENTIGISIIDMSIRKNLQAYENKYVQCMIYNIINYIKQRKTVYLFSFCKEENDEKAIENIIQKIPEQYKNKIKKVYYDGNIKKFMETYKKMEYMICCRFHAKILSVALGQKMYILSYSKKIDNVVQDLSLAEKYTNIENLKENTNIELKDFKKVDKEKINQIREESKKQLLKIDEWYLETKS